ERLCEPPEGRHGGAGCLVHGDVTLRPCSAERPTAAGVRVPGLERTGSRRLRSSLRVTTENRIPWNRRLSRGCLLALWYRSCETGGCLFREDFICHLPITLIRPQPGTLP